MPLPSHPQQYCNLVLLVRNQSGSQVIPFKMAFECHRYIQMYLAVLSYFLAKSVFLSSLEHFSENFQLFLAFLAFFQQFLASFQQVFLASFFSKFLASFQQFLAYFQQVLAYFQQVLASFQQVLAFFSKISAKCCPKRFLIFQHFLAIF